MISCVWGVCVCVQKLWQGRKEKQIRWWKGSRSKNSCVDKVVYTYVSAACAFFSTEHDVQVRQHLRDEVGTWQRTTHNNGLSLVLRHGDIIMKTCQFWNHRRITDTWTQSTAQCLKCHACHAKWRWMSPSAVPATQSAATCRQVPRLPRKTPRRHGATPKTKRATKASPVP